MDTMKKPIKNAIMQKVVGSGRRLATSDLVRELSRSLDVSPKDVRRAMNELVFEGRLEYTFFGQSYLELPLNLVLHQLHSPHLHEKAG